MSYGCTEKAYFEDLVMSFATGGSIFKDYLFIVLPGKMVDW
jgi:hypothetical protein